MSLRRTALVRRTELRRTPLQRKTPMRRAAKALRAQVAKGRKDTGPTREQRVVVFDRALGCCEICATPVICHELDRWLPIQSYSIHHRAARGMGGRKVEWINSPANLLLLCGTGTTGCHGHVESSRAEAYRNGWLVRASADPAEVPVLLAGSDRYLLTDDGDRIEVAA
ncbi:hypothetical protein KVF89_22565 [Nocardioides carbamazepini]|uniref:hypothetical protein n=1 Tax=Nocardioides carbamazepini TaxID=2854259 RepID=UPI002149A72E|nr:hypothetical protein [Nocardioides carbamazepini]MCR1785341.1 hypothetical protein [Nocardioides carbamazepini]